MSVVKNDSEVVKNVKENVNMKKNVDVKKCRYELQSSHKRLLKVISVFFT